MTPQRPDLAAYALAALCVIGIIVLAALRVAVPEILPYLAVFALGGGAGLSIAPRAPRRSTDAQ